LVDTWLVLGVIGWVARPGDAWRFGRQAEADENGVRRPGLAHISDHPQPSAASNASEDVGFEVIVQGRG
jgi:hypothetical protein